MTEKNDDGKTNKGVCIESFVEAIQNNDVLQEKHYHIRPCTTKDGYYEHLFAVACRFPLQDDNSLYMYATHVHIGTKTVTHTKRKEIWSMVKAQLVSNPQQWLGVPDNVYFKHLCEMDGWTS